MPYVGHCWIKIPGRSFLWEVEYFPLHLKTTGLEVESFRSEHIKELNELLDSVIKEEEKGK